MFRPRSEPRVFSTVPIRHILVVRGLGLAVTALQVIGLERDQAAIEQSLRQREAGGPPEPGSAFGRARANILSEVVQLERQPRQADRMAALGTLSAGLAHEIKNLLSALELNLHLPAEELGEREQPRPGVRRYLDILGAEIKRLQAVVENVVRISRPTGLNLAPLNLNNLLSHVVALVDHEARQRKVGIHADLDPTLPPVPGDDTQLCQVFLNLLLNGLQAMPDGGTLIVSAGARLDPPATASVRVSDAGDGIAPGHVGRLFDPCFTTREGGAGLGLGIADRIVRDHGERSRSPAPKGRGPR